MALSHYLKRFSCSDAPGLLLVYSTRRASLLRVSRGVLDALDDGTLSTQDKTLLAVYDILVEDVAEEKQAMAGWIDRVNAENTRLKLTVVLNLDCNFACPYCYEGKMKGRFYMSDQTETDLIAFVADRLTPDKTALTVDFYGGEPLLSIPRICSISRKIRALAGGRGATYGFTLVTNGSLFTRKVAEKLVPLGLKGVKITLDGPAEIHNTTRPFKNGGPSFDIIIDNILHTCDRVKIGIGGNFDRENYRRFIDLLDGLLGRGLGPEKICRIKFDPVMAPPKNARAEGCSSGCASINEPWLAEAALTLREAILERGYHTSKPGLSPCMVDIDDAFVVHYDGSLYKCPAFVGNKNFEVGTLRTGLADDLGPYNTGIWKNDPCLECAWLPQCFGGCRYMAWCRDGAIDRPDCQKAFLDAFVESAVRQDLKYRSCPRIVPDRSKKSIHHRDAESAEIKISLPADDPAI